MTLDAMRRALVRDLGALRRELEAYPRESDLWVRPDGIANPGGALARHLTGNIRHFIGAQLGGTAYVRDRAAEFADRTTPRATLLAEVDAAIREADAALRALPVSRLAEPYPLEVGGVRLATDRFLTHLLTHFAYHLGQLDYHRRVVTGVAGGVGAQAIGELA
jgi:hypothetical protein